MLDIFSTFQREATPFFPWKRINFLSYWNVSNGQNTIFRAKKKILSLRQKHVFFSYESRNPKIYYFSIKVETMFNILQKMWTILLLINLKNKNTHITFKLYKYHESVKKIYKNKKKVWKIEPLNYFNDVFFCIIYSYLTRIFMNAQSID